jgi:hypothetical protein
MMIQLPPLEARILQLRHGLFDGQSYTAEEVGRRLGVTRERVCQLEAQALMQLMANWPILLDALRHLWALRKVSELKSQFYEPIARSKAG